MTCIYHPPKQFAHRPGEVDVRIPYVTPVFDARGQSVESLAQLEVLATEAVAHAAQPRAVLVRDVFLEFR